MRDVEFQDIFRHVVSVIVSGSHGISISINLAANIQTVAETHLPERFPDSMRTKRDAQSNDAAKKKNVISHYFPVLFL